MTHHKTSMFIAAAATAALTAPFTSTTAQAALWNVDFSSSGEMSGAAVVGSDGDYWNLADTGDADTDLAILDSGGVSNANDITLNFTAPNDDLFGFAADASANPAALLDGIGASANVGSGSAGSTKNFDFSGLDPNTTYNIVAYGASQAGTDRGTYFFSVIDGPILGSTTGASTDIDDASNPGTTYTQFQITSDESGAFSILTNFNSGSSAQAPVNGFQIQSVDVPEPASIGLLSLGGLLTLTRRRRGTDRA